MFLQGKDIKMIVVFCFPYLYGETKNHSRTWRREVSHQHEYNNDNEHVIKSFVFVFVFVFAMHIKWVYWSKTKITARFKRLFASIRHKPMDNMPKNSNNKIVLYFQRELVHKSKKMNQIMFVWSVRKWKPILVDASETTEDDVTILTHVPTKWWRVRYHYHFRAGVKLPYWRRPEDSGGRINCFDFHHDIGRVFVIDKPFNPNHANAISIDSFTARETPFSAAIHELTILGLTVGVPTAATREIHYLISESR
jgi:hypothetical protein